MIDFDVIARALEARKKWDETKSELVPESVVEEIIDGMTQRRHEETMYPRVTWNKFTPYTIPKDAVIEPCDLSFNDIFGINDVINKRVEEIKRREVMKDNILVVIGEKDGYKAYRPEGITYEPASPTDWKKPFDRYHIDVKLSPSSERYFTLDALRRAYSEPKKIIFNGPATIVFWKDGTKTVVKAENEAFDPEKGIAMAYLKKFLGNQGNYFNTIKKAIKMAERVE